MQTRILFLTGTLISFVFLTFCTTKSFYKNDGIYEGRSQSVYKSEPFLAVSKIHIANGRISRIEFQIKDTINNEIFDDKYEKHFIGNDHYINQCRNDWKGVQLYPQQLLKTQNIDQIDAISGATWSYNMFKSSVSEALKNVQKK